MSELETRHPCSEIMIFFFHTIKIKIKKGENGGKGGEGNGINKRWATVVKKPKNERREGIEERNSHAS